MTRIDRYIFKVVLATGFVALLVLVALESFFALLEEIEDVGTGNYGLGEVIHYLTLNLPTRAYRMFPMALLLGGLLGMGGLAATSELTAMRASGVSVYRLVGSAMLAGLILGLAALALGELVAPPLERAAERLQHAAKQKEIRIRGGRGFWARDGDRFIHVRSVLPGLRLANIDVYELDEDFELQAVTRAKGARFEGDAWVLDGVRRSFLEGDRVTTDRVVRLNWDSFIEPSMLDVLASKPEDLSMRDLLAFTRYLEGNGLDAASYRLAFWAKLLTPLTNLAMLYIAMPFVFGSQRSAGVGQRLVIGVFLGLLFVLANRMLGNAVLLYGFHPLVGASLPTVVFIAAGTYGLARVR